MCDRKSIFYLNFYRNLQLIEALVLISDPLSSKLSTKRQMGVGWMAADNGNCLVDLILLSLYARMFCYCSQLSIGGGQQQHLGMDGHSHLA